MSKEEALKETSLYFDGLAKPSADIQGSNLKTNRLFISLRNNSTLSWDASPWKGDNWVEPWQDFYTWFFEKVDDPNYVFKYTSGETMIQRVDILSFNISVRPI